MAHQKDDTFHEYSAGSDALPWKGWYEDKDGEVTAWVDLANRVHIRIDTEFAPECTLAERNAAWNNVRDFVRSASLMPIEPGKTDYWPQSTVACLMSLAMKELQRAPKGESRDAKDRRRRTLRTLEDVFAATETFLPGKNPARGEGGGLAMAALGRVATDASALLQVMSEADEPVFRSFRARLKESLRTFSVAAEADLNDEKARSEDEENDDRYPDGDIR